MQQNRKDLLFLLFALFGTLTLTSNSGAQQRPCFSAEEHARAEKAARVYRSPDPGYDPVIGYNPARGPRIGSPLVNTDGVAQRINCVANTDETPGAGTPQSFFARSLALLIRTAS